MGFLRKVANRLRVTIFREQEIVLGQIADDLAVLVANSDGQCDHFDVDRHRSNRGRILTLRRPIGQEEADQSQSLSGEAEPVRRSLSRSRVI